MVPTHNVAPPMTPPTDPTVGVRVARHLRQVRYEIRGPLARRAHEIERAATRSSSSTSATPAFRLSHAGDDAARDHREPDEAEAYCHQKGIFPAREAVVMHTQSRGIAGVTADDVFMGNGVCELILMTHGGAARAGDEVLVPAPDYPLWTAAVVHHRGQAVHYPCRPENGFVPDPRRSSALIDPRCTGDGDHQSQ